MHETGNSPLYSIFLRIITINEAFREPGVMRCRNSHASGAQRSKTQEVTNVSGK